MTPEQAANYYSIPLSTAINAYRHVEGRSAMLLGVSGKFGAGKDTIAPLLLERLGYTAYKQGAYAEPLKDEVGQIIGIILASSSPEEAERCAADSMGVAEAAIIVNILYEAVKKRGLRSSRERTPEARRALQWWGTDVRRSKDDSYWVRKTIALALTDLAEGKSVFITDARFPNEAEAIPTAGGHLVRLDVSLEIQLDRLWKRDRFRPTEEMLMHPSEIGLDDYPFTVRVDTDRLNVEETVIELSRQLQGFCKE